mmetsp:Transcript_26965/g.54243  ORF Transcript_26965/g.54243 Transcript_26965/m.54243 type:complete len:311 (+) Transcript_26965:418-1350(+)
MSSLSHIQSPWELNMTSGLTPYCVPSQKSPSPSAICGMQPLQMLSRYASENLNESKEGAICTTIGRQLLLVVLETEQKKELKVALSMPVLSSSPAKTAFAQPFSQRSPSMLGSTMSCMTKGCSLQKLPSESTAQISFRSTDTGRPPRRHDDSRALPHCPLHMMLGWGGENGEVSQMPTSADKQNSLLSPFAHTVSSFDMHVAEDRSHTSYSHSWESVASQPETQEQLHCIPVKDKCTPVAHGHVSWAWLMHSSRVANIPTDSILSKSRELTHDTSQSQEASGPGMREVTESTHWLPHSSVSSLVEGGSLG